MNLFVKKSSFIGIFSFLLPLSSVFAGNVEYHLNKSANPTQDELDAYEHITAAMDSTYRSLLQHGRADR